MAFGFSSSPLIAGRVYPDHAGGRQLVPWGVWRCSLGSKKDEEHQCHESRAAWLRASGWQQLHSTKGSCALGRQQMKDYGISTAALILSFVTALPPFPLELFVQNHFRLKYVTSIFSCKRFWFLGHVGPVFPVRAECGDFTSAACETFLWSSLSLLEGCFTDDSGLHFFLKL